MKQTDLRKLHILKLKIAAGRQRLQKLYDVHGCSDDVVLAASIELDVLINQYRKMTEI
jgi:hypothetical protein